MTIVLYCLLCNKKNDISTYDSDPFGAVDLIAGNDGPNFIL